MKRWFSFFVFASLATALAAWPVVASAQPKHGEHVDVHGATDPHGDDPKHAPGTEHAGGEHAAPEFNLADFDKKDAHGNKVAPYIALAANFLVLIGLYYFLGRKPIALALKNRRTAIAKEIEEAQRMKHEAEERAKMYQAKLETLEEELATTKLALVEAGKGEKERIIKDAEEKAARMQKDAEFLIDQEMKQIRQDLWRDTVQMAVATAEELLKKRITPSDQERLAEDYLADLAGQEKQRTSMAPKPSPSMAPGPKGGAS